jgi:diphthamide synthase (EF-2-diphthine--ammonia ligase)
LHDAGLKGIFPLWMKGSSQLIADFLDAGFKTVICSADARYFHIDQMGKIIDRDFIESLPSAVDVCGENGEFHTFVYDGPIFSHPINFEKGKVVDKDYAYKVTRPNGEIDELKNSFLFQDLF